MDALFQITTYHDLTTLTELAHLGHYVLHGFKREGEKYYHAHEDMYQKIKELYKSETLKLHSERREELDDIDDYLIDHCGDMVAEFEREHVAEFLAGALGQYGVGNKLCRETMLHLFANRK